MKIKTIALSIALIGLTGLAACTGKGKSEGTADSATDDAGFVESQPLESGQYNVVHYIISGDNGRKGSFDGRMLISLSPEQSAFYVYENGNRAKIDYLVLLASPFEKNDTAYVTTDSKGKKVVMQNDSTGYKLTFEKNNSTVELEVEKAPRFTGTAFEILEKIQAEKGK